MRYLHTMLRVRDLDAALDFYCNKLGLKEMRRRVDEKNKYTLVFLAAPGDGDLVAKGPAGREAPLVELTYNWDSGEDYGDARYFGHLAYEVDDIYALCERLMKAGVTINRPPRDGMMAFVRSPDKQSIELLQKGAGAAAQGAVGLDAQYRALVTASAAFAASTAEARLPKIEQRVACAFFMCTVIRYRKASTLRSARPLWMALRPLVTTSTCSIFTLKNSIRCSRPRTGGDTTT